MARNRKDARTGEGRKRVQTLALNEEKKLSGGREIRDTCTLRAWKRLKDAPPEKERRRILEAIERGKIYH